MRVLIAEDGGVARKILETNLKKWGYEVVATSNGLQAWEELNKEDAPCLAILDWLMPDMTGPEVCKKIREQETNKYTYVILVTARGQKDDIFEGFAAGADDYLTKPYDKQELFWRLRVGERIVRLQSTLNKKSSKVDDIIRDFQKLSTRMPACNEGDKMVEIEAFLQSLGSMLASAQSENGTAGQKAESADQIIKPLTKIIPETIPGLADSKEP
jgi:sigma-B regulation protein RsbU (phosphoserine phosphatase)